MTALRLRSLAATALALAAPAALAGGPVAALWANPAGGTWNDPANWSPAVIPNAADIAVTIGVEPAQDGYTVTLDNPVTVGSLTVDEDRALRLRSNLTIASGSLVNNGRINTVSPAALTLGGVGFISGSGVLTVQRLTTLTAAGPGSPSLANNAGHTITGQGTIAATLTNAGIIAPAGVLTATAGVLFLPGSSLELELIGPPTAFSSRLSVSGVALLAGTLRINALSGPTSAESITFDVLTASSTLGTFDALDRSAIGPGLSVAITYEPTRVRVTFTPCPADLADQPGLLDINDILAFATAFASADPAGDAFPDGMYDVNDILAYATAFTEGCP